MCTELWSTARGDCQRAAGCRTDELIHDGVDEVDGGVHRVGVESEGLAELMQPVDQQVPAGQELGRACAGGYDLRTLRCAMRAIASRRCISMKIWLARARAARRAHGGRQHQPSRSVPAASLRRRASWMALGSRMSLQSSASTLAIAAAAGVSGSDSSQAMHTATVFSGGLCGKAEMVPGIFRARCATSSAAVSIQHFPPWPATS